jgi:rubrerythrin
MIATASASRFVLRVLAPLVWRSDVKIAGKLEGFAATEAGSALDMLKAAELTDDPRLRRLFFEHALDEARHAQLFRDRARQLLVGSRRKASEYDVIRATRQNLYERLGLVRFVAFVYLAERRGELQFRALGDHFRGRPDLEALFRRIGRDERFHVAYSRKLLGELRSGGQARAVRRALLRIRLGRARDAWLRAGRIFGDLMSRALLGLLYLVVLPLFVLVSRALDPARAGWKRRALPPSSIDAARRQY